jgi:hypothetical protein
MAWFTYGMEPVDSGWQRLRTVVDCADDIGKDERSNLPAGTGYMHYGYRRQEFLRAFESALEAAREAGYDGEPRQPPVVFWLPVGDTFEPGFIIKQDNDGYTFVMSPVPMPHLDN